MKKISILIVAILLLCGIYASAQEPAVPILLYHNVSETYNMQDALLHVSPQRFEEQIVALKSAGYNIISMQDYVKYVNDDETLPENPVIITFDDGYSSVYYHAFPILEKHRVPATIYIITGLVGFRDTSYPHFTWEQAREMDKSEYIDIQSHTNFHYNSTEIPLPRLILELRKSKYDIESRLNKKCNLLAFPYGAYTTEGLHAALRAGYECIVRTEDRGTNRKSDGLFRLNRIFVRGNWTGDYLVRTIEENNKLYIN